MMRRLFLLFLCCVLIIGSAISAQAAPPVATSFSATVSTVGSTQIQLQGSDPDGTALAFVVTGGPSHGTLSSFNTVTGYFVYTPATGYVGTDTLTFTVTSGAQTSAAATATITVTNAKTRIIDTLIDPSGVRRQGTVTFILTQKAQSPGGLIPLGASASAILNSNGQFDISVYPSTALVPQSYYQVYIQDSGSLKRELLGVYNIPALTTTTTLEPNRVTNTSLQTQYTFASAEGVNSLVSGGISNSPTYSGLVTMNGGASVPGGQRISFGSGSEAAPSQSDVATGTRLLIWPGPAPSQLAIGVESGHFWFTSPAYKFYFNAGANGVATWNSSGLTLPGTVTATSFVGAGSGLTGINFSQLVGSVTDAQVPDTITLSNFNQIGIRSASDLNTGTLPSARLPAEVVTASGGAASAYGLFTSGNAMTSGYLKQETNAVSISGTGAGPAFRIYGAGIAGGADTARAAIKADPNLIEMTAEGTGTLAGQVTAIRLNSLNGGLVQLAQSGTIMWEVDSGEFLPRLNATRSIGSAAKSVLYLNMAGNVIWNNSGAQQVSLSSPALNTLRLERAGGGHLSASLRWTRLKRPPEAWRLPLRLMLWRACDCTCQAQPPTSLELALSQERCGISYRRAASSRITSARPERSAARRAIAS